MTILAQRLTWGVRRKTIVRNVSLDVAQGETLGLIGPNGSGKSSLLRLLAGLRRPESGHVVLNGRNIAGVGRRELSKTVAFVQQSAATDTNVSVRDVVKLGRTPHRSALAGWTRHDEAAVQAGLKHTGMSGHASQRWQTLSGGERKRAHIARALTQEPSIMFLDEPTNHLDIHHQIEILRLIRALDLTSIVALHDLNLAAMFCDRIVVLDQGEVVAAGLPEDVLTAELLRDVFKIAARVRPSSDNRYPEIQYLIA